MVRTAINDPWRPDDDPGRQPEPIDQWVSAGFAVEEAEIWRNWRFCMRTADAWRGAAVLDGLQAARWSAAGVTPNTVGQWRRAGIEATEAITWNELGISFGEARQNKAKGVTPDEAYSRVSPQPPPVPTQANPALPLPNLHAGGGMLASGRAPSMGPGFSPFLLRNYMMRQWAHEEAMAWASEGIDVIDAELWRAMGLRPSEAARFVQDGSSAAEAVLGWWRAGIPVDEVADWIGAGLERGRGGRADALEASLLNKRPLCVPFATSQWPVRRLSRQPR